MTERSAPPSGSARPVASPPSVASPLAELLAARTGVRPEVAVAQALRRRLRDGEAEAGRLDALLDAAAEFRAAHAAFGDVLARART